MDKTYIKLLKGLKSKGESINTSYGEGWRLAKIVNVLDDMVEIELEGDAPGRRISMHYSRLVYSNIR